MEMYFCANVKCLFHVKVPEDMWSVTVALPAPVPDMISPMDVAPEAKAVTPEVKAVTRGKHLWKDGKKGTEWFLCDNCHEIKMKG